jgi:hypothetical protein
MVEIPVYITILKEGSPFAKRQTMIFENTVLLWYNFPKRCGADDRQAGANAAKRAALGKEPKA